MKNKVVTKNSDLNAAFIFLAQFFSSRIITDFEAINLNKCVIFFEKSLYFLFLKYQKILKVIGRRKKIYVRHVCQKKNL